MKVLLSLAGLVLLVSCASGDDGNYPHVPAGADRGPADGGDRDSKVGDERPSGEAAGDDAAGDDTAGDPSPVEPSNFSVLGPYSVSVSSGALTVNGCNLAYGLHTPTGGPDAPLVVLGHGFQRDASNMAEVASHVASWGLRVATPSYCHSSILDADHQQNGLDAAALSAELAAGAAVVHAGHSAGGASAFVAAANDPAAVGLAGLDAVDNDDVALSAAAEITVPTFGLVGESSSCNSNNNGIPLYSAAVNGWAVRVIETVHCDFESPTSYFGCELLCGNADADRQTLVASMLAAFSAWVTNTDATGGDWVEPAGTTYNELVADSVIDPL